MNRTMNEKGTAGIVEPRKSLNNERKSNKCINSSNHLHLFGYECLLFYFILLLNRVACLLR